MVLAANQRFYAALEALDLDLMSEIWLHEDWVKCIHPGWGPIDGWLSVRESWEQIFRNAQEIRIFLDHAVARVEGRIGWVSCVENIYDRSVNELETAQALSTNIFFFTDGRWRLTHHHSSLLPHSTTHHPGATVQ